jgi:hypothetical protein
MLDARSSKQDLAFFVPENGSRLEESSVTNVTARNVRLRQAALG